MKVGISISINLEKMENARLYKGKKGTYLDLTTFVNLDEVDQYGNNGFIAQTVSKEERDNNVKGAILGNCKVFFTDAQESPQQHSQPSPAQGNNQPQGFDDFADSDIPF